jgi:hypothetical protein
MRIGQTKTIKIPDNFGDYESVDAVYIGRGSFATCYRVGDSVISFVKVSDNFDRSDYSKEIISLIDSDNVHIPQIEKLGYSEDYNYMIFKCPFYSPLKADNVKAWRQYKKLKDAWESSFSLYCNESTNYDANERVINSLPDTMRKVKDALHLINMSSSNYSLNYRLEFPKRNLKVDSFGNLILLDVIFNPLAY